MEERATAETARGLERETSRSFGVFAAARISSAEQQQDTAETLAGVQPHTTLEQPTAPRHTRLQETTARSASTRVKSAACDALTWQRVV